jgi:integrase
VRPGELRHAEWAEIDFVGAQWVIPADKMGTRRPHTVPLSRQAISILRDLQRRTGDGRYLFPQAKSPDRCMSANAVDAAFRRMGLKISSYCFRMMATRIAHEVLGFSVESVERQLARTTADRLTGLNGSPLQYLEQRRDMMQKLADYLDTVKEAAIIPVKG